MVKFLYSLDGVYLHLTNCIDFLKQTKTKISPVAIREYKSATLTKLIIQITINRTLTTHSTSHFHPIPSSSLLSPTPPSFALTATLRVLV